MTNQVGHHLLRKEIRLIRRASKKRGSDELDRPDDGGRREARQDYCKSSKKLKNGRHRTESEQLTVYQERPVFERKLDDSNLSWHLVDFVQAAE